jgi:hypothetical protein
MSTMGKGLSSARLKLKSTRGILDMMSGNTDSEYLKKSEHDWLDPIVERIEEPEA